jgi:hypothetical protein
MKKISLIFAILGFAGQLALAQAPPNPIFTMSASGGVTGVLHAATTNPTYFGSIGKPMVMPRNAATNAGGGALVANNLVFTSSSVDATAPIFQSASTLNTLIHNAANNFTATVTDNFPSQTTMRLIYRPIAGLLYDSIDFTVTSTTATTRSFSLQINNASLPNTEYDAVGMEYYFKVVDSRNPNRSPASGTLKAYTQINAPYNFPSNVLASYGDKILNYHMITFPYEPSDNAVTTIFNELNTRTAKTDYRLFRYEAGAYQEYPGSFNTFDRGRGYFMIIKDPISLDLGTNTAPQNNRASLEQISLQQGWNLIGNPYPVTINWSNVKTLNGFSADAKIWNGTTFAVAGDILPFQGAFVFANSAVTLTIPFKGQTASGGRTEAVFNTDLNASAWKLNIDVQQGAIKNQLNGFGMHPEASQETDDFDDYHPPHFSDFAELQFPHPKHMLGSFAQDIVPTKNEYVWRFNAEMSTNDRSELMWDNTNMVYNDIELYLYDVRTHAIINMREENNYSFLPGQSKEFKIYYGQDVFERIGPDEITVDEPYPNPFSVKTPVNFVLGLPDNLVASYPVEMIIHNSVGIPVHAQAEALAPGLHTLTWTAHKSNNEMLPAGFYFYTIKIGARNFTGKVILTNQND